MPVRERGQGEPTPGQHVPFSGHVQAHTPGESRAFAPAATEDTGERDSPPEEAGFEPSVPLGDFADPSRWRGNRRRSSERPFLYGGTDGSNPVPSSGESGTNCTATRHDDRPFE